MTVDGEPCRDVSAAVRPDQVAFDGEPYVAPMELAMYHKPVGVQCTVGDPRGRANLQEYVPELLAAGLHPVGRLDADTSGLLLFARDGQLTQRLLHPRHGVPKTYLATVEGTPGPELVAQMAAGVETSLGVHTATVEQIEGQVVRITVHEGKHRMVRRMLHNAGHSVIALHRVAMGPYQLGDLAVDHWLPADPADFHNAS